MVGTLLAGRKALSALFILKTTAQGQFHGLSFIQVYITRYLRVSPIESLEIPGLLANVQIFGDSGSGFSPSFMRQSSSMIDHVTQRGIST